MTTTAPTTSKVTVRMSDSWKSLQASEYQCVASPGGSQVPNQRVAKESMITTAITAKTLMTKTTTTAQMAIRHSRAPSPSSRIMASSFRPADGTAVEQLAAGQDRHDDDELHRPHDHRDRGAEGVVVLLEGRLISGDGDDMRAARRRAQQ